MVLPFILALAVATGLFGLDTSLAATDLESCAAIQDGAERLACYDGLASGPGVSERNAQTERDTIIARCREQMGQYGSAMVKACVDQDMAAYSVLQTYASEHGWIIERCVNMMQTYGWSMVKACADQDIEAERALSDQ